MNEELIKKQKRLLIDKLDTGDVKGFRHLIREQNIAVAHFCSKHFSLTHYAAQKGAFFFLKMLLETYKVDPYLRSEEEQNTLLHEVAISGDLTALAYLIKRFFWKKIDIKNKDGLTPLHLSIIYGHSFIAKFLLEHCGASPYIATQGGTTLLHMAASQQDTHFIQYLLEEKEMDVNVADKYGFTPLFYVVRRGDFFMTKWLIQTYQADPSLVSKKGHNLLHIACLAKSADLLLYLIQEEKLDVNHANLGGYTPIFAALEIGDHVTFDLLLKMGASAHLKDNKGNTLLHKAAFYGKKSFIPLLIKKYKLSPNQLNHEGYSATFLAALKGRKEALYTLLEAYEADPYIKTSKGLSLRSGAFLSKNQDIDLYLKETHHIDLTRIDKAIRRQKRGLFFSSHLGLTQAPSGVEYTTKKWLFLPYIASCWYFIYLFLSFS